MEKMMAVFCPSAEETPFVSLSSCAIALSSNSSTSFAAAPSRL